MTIMLALIAWQYCFQDRTKPLGEAKAVVRCSIVAVIWEPGAELTITGEIKSVGKLAPRLRGIETVYIRFYDAAGKLLRTDEDHILTSSDFCTGRADTMGFFVTSAPPKGAKSLTVELYSATTKSQPALLPKLRK